MRKIISLFMLCAFLGNIYAQKPKTKQPSQAEIDKMMDDAFKGMSKEDAAMMKKIIKEQGNKPAAQLPVNLDDVFKDNKQLIPAKNSSKISAKKKQYSAADVTSNVNSMYTKLLAKGDAAQIAMAKKAMLVAKTCTALMDAANTAMFQGQPHTALLLSLKAVQTCPANLVAQNNVAALLTQYGYPEQAIPFLQKINNEQKGNSTVLNNLAFAWLGLGDTEKAYQFASGAVMHNPQHPQSRLLCGVILEKEGKTEEAKQQIEIAKKFNSTKLTEHIGKNSGEQSSYPKLSWEELKKKISVYQYFPKGWRKTYIAEQNNVAYNNAYNSGTLSDQRMREAFSKKMSEIIKAKNVIADAEMDDEGAMLKKIMQTNPNSLLPLSSKITQALFHSFSNEIENKWKPQLPLFQKYENEIFERRFAGFVRCEVKSHKTGNECTDEAHQKSLCKQNQETWATNCNKIMQEYNPQWLAFKDKFEEEIRFYYNAMLTWLLLGNTPALEKANEIMALELVDSYFRSNYGFNVNLEMPYFQIAPFSCGEASQNAQLTILPLPEIPNLNCLVIFKIPSGFGSLDFSNKGFSAADNEYGITANGTNKSPAMSTSLGTSGSRVSEPGLDKDPYTNTSSGSTEPVVGIPDDEELNPIPKNATKTNDDDEELNPLPKPSAVNSNWNDDELTPLISDKDRDLRNARETARRLMNENMSKVCENETTKKKRKMENFIKSSAALDKLLEQEEALKEEQIRKANYDDDKLWPLPKPNKETNIEKVKTKYGEMKSALKEAADNLGFTPTQNNGFTLPGKITGFVAGLFN